MVVCFSACDISFMGNRIGMLLYLNPDTCGIETVFSRVPSAAGIDEPVCIKKGVV